VQINGNGKFPLRVLSFDLKRASFLFFFNNVYFLLLEKIVESCSNMIHNVHIGNWQLSDRKPLLAHLGKIAF